MGRREAGGWAERGGREGGKHICIVWHSPSLAMPACAATRLGMISQLYDAPALPLGWARLLIHTAAGFPLTQTHAHSGTLLECPRPCPPPQTVAARPIRCAHLDPSPPGLLPPPGPASPTPQRTQLPRAGCASFLEEERQDAVRTASLHCGCPLRWALDRFREILCLDLTVTTTSTCNRQRARDIYCIQVPTVTARQ
jgi:hypothetical protein